MSLISLVAIFGSNRVVASNNEVECSMFDFLVEEEVVVPPPEPEPDPGQHEELVQVAGRGRGRGQPRYRRGRGRSSFSERERQIQSGCMAAAHLRKERKCNEILQHALAPSLKDHVSASVMSSTAHEPRGSDSRIVLVGDERLTMPKANKNHQAKHAKEAKGTICSIAGSI